MIDYMYDDCFHLTWYIGYKYVKLYLLYWVNILKLLYIEVYFISFLTY